MYSEMSQPVHTPRYSDPAAVLVLVDHIIRGHVHSRAADTVSAEVWEFIWVHFNILDTPIFRNVCLICNRLCTLDVSYLCLVLI